MRRIFATAATALAICVAGSTQAATIVNGSFETGSFTAGAFDTLGAGSTAITGWTVGGAGVDWLGSFMPASDGDRSVDMSALGAGSLSQTIATKVGQSYKLRFDLASNPDGGAPPIKQLAVAIGGGTPTIFAFDSAGSTFANPGWLKQTYVFTATSASSELSFTSLANSASGPALDNVQISAVPEAATWAMMIAGFGLAGAMMRRRRDVATA